MEIAAKLIREQMFGKYIMEQHEACVARHCLSFSGLYEVSALADAGIPQ
jgi:hypothetical protein